MPSPTTRRGWLTPILVSIAIFQLLWFFFRRNASVEQFRSDLSGLLPDAWPSVSWPGTMKPDSASVHPIQKLMENAKTKYTSMMNRQSRSLIAAVNEYERRYGKPPPRGFEHWYEFAMKNEVKVIDEYDSMMDDLKPFEKLSGRELRNRAKQVGQLPSIHLVEIQNKKSRIITNANFKDSEARARARGFEIMLEKFIDKLPDMAMPINAQAEGRILVPWEHQMFPNLTEQDSFKGVRAMLGGEFVPDWRGDGNVWEAFRRTCSPDSQARRLFSSLRSKLKEGQHPINHFKNMKGSGLDVEVESDFEFPESIDDDFDFCNKPWARYKQGHFFSDWRTIPVYYPVFSPAKAKGYGDILIPSHYYHQSTQRYTYGWDPKLKKIKDKADGETSWVNKTKLIFWRGATTGGGSSPPGFVGEYQRHRFIRMVSDGASGNRTVTFAWPPWSTDNFVTVDVPIQSLNNEMIDAAFTKAVGCIQYPGGCPAMQRDHRFADAVPLGEHWRHRYLVDFDGMGYSARVFAFLASDSAVIKSTVYKEFFSDWIQPWLHYIPLSMSYKEIYNIHAYFSGPSPSMLSAANLSLESLQSSTNVDKPPPPVGDMALRKIAQAGRVWKNTIARKADMEAYVYRLCLEYARLWADNRDEWNYESRLNHN